MARCHIYTDSKASAEKLIQRDQIPPGTDRIQERGWPSFNGFNVPHPQSSAVDGISMDRHVGALHESMPPPVHAKVVL